MQSLTAFEVIVNFPEQIVKVAKTARTAAYVLYLRLVCIPMHIFGEAVCCFVDYDGLSFEPVADSDGVTGQTPAASQKSFRKSFLG